MGLLIIVIDIDFPVFKNSVSRCAELGGGGGGGGGLRDENKARTKIGSV